MVSIFSLLATASAENITSPISSIQFAWSARAFSPEPACRSPVSTVIASPYSATSSTKCIYCTYNGKSKLNSWIIPSVCF